MIRSDSVSKILMLFSAELLDSSTGIVLPGPTEPRLGETNLDELQRITNQANDGFNGKVCNFVIILYFTLS